MPEQNNLLPEWIQRGLEDLFPSSGSKDPAENFNKRSRDFDEIYHDAGQFYWGKSSAWLEDKVFFANHSIPIKIPRYKVQ